MTSWPGKKLRFKGTLPPDPINPSHYMLGNVETIDFIKSTIGPVSFLGYLHGNVVKYVSRALHKGNPLEDMRKAQWYLDRWIKEMNDGNYSS